MFKEKGIYRKKYIKSKQFIFSLYQIMLAIKNAKHQQCMLHFFSDLTKKKCFGWLLHSVSVMKSVYGTAWKVTKYGVISVPYFPVFGLNT